MNGNADTAVENNDNLLMAAIDDTEARQEMIEGLSDEMRDTILRQGYAYEYSGTKNGEVVRLKRSIFDFMFDENEDSAAALFDQMAIDSACGHDLELKRSTVITNDVLHKSCVNYVTKNLESILNGESH